MSDDEAVPAVGTGPCRLDDVEVVALRELYAKGAKQVELAVRFGVNQNTVSSIVTGRSRKQAGGPITRGRGRKLAHDDVVAIRAAAAEGARVDDLSARYGVSQQAVSNIISGRAFPDLPGALMHSREKARPLKRGEVDEIRTRAANGESRTSLSKVYGVGVSTIAAAIQGRIGGIGGGAQDGLTREAVVEIRERYQAGATQVVLAAEYGIVQEMVSEIVRGRMYREYGGPLAGRRTRRLTSSRVVRIREAFAQGASTAELASRFGLIDAVVRQIVTGATYPSAAGPVFSIDRRGRIVGPGDESRPKPSL